MNIIKLPQAFQTPEHYLDHLDQAQSLESSLYQTCFHFLSVNFRYNIKHVLHFVNSIYRLPEVCLYLEQICFLVNLFPSQLCRRAGLLLGHPVH